MKSLLGDRKSSRNHNLFSFHLVQLQEITNRALSAIHKTLRNARLAEAYFVFNSV